MIRVLIIIAVASFVLAVACFSGAAALGGRDIVRNGWTFPADIFIEDNGDSVRISSGGENEASETRELPWTGGESLQIDLAANVSYSQGPEAKVVISGPRSLVDRIQLDGDRLHMIDGEQIGGRRRLRTPLTISITAPSVKRFVLNGAPDLSIVGYDQPEMTVEINGSGDVSASGRAAKLALAISGSGDADLGGIDAGDASVSIAGSGDAKLSPKGAASVAIAGSGNVTLLTKPASLTSDIGGSGDLRLED